MPSAQFLARREVVLRHPDEYRMIYLEEKEKAEKNEETNVRSKAQHRATTALVRRYNNEYHAAYKKFRETGFPRNVGRKK